MQQGLGSGLTACTATLASSVHRQSRMLILPSFFISVFSPLIIQVYNCTSVKDGKQRWEQSLRLFYSFNVYVLAENLIIISMFKDCFAI